MDERDFLAEARLLAAQPREAAWRTATGRAYYTAYHVARLLLEGMGFAVPHSDRAHGYLWLRLGNCGDASAQAAGHDFHGLRGTRNVADYDLHRSFSQGAAQAAIATAERIIQALDALAAGPNLVPVRDGMICYERDVLKDVTWAP